MPETEEQEEEIKQTRQDILEKIKMVSEDTSESLSSDSPTEMELDLMRIDNFGDAIENYEQEA